MTLTEEAKDELIEDIYGLDFTFNSWDPQLQVWRAGEGHSRTLPYVAVDFVATSDKRFASLGDIVGRIDDDRYEYAFCELELMTVTVYADKYHNSGAVRGRDFAYFVIEKIRKRILAYWRDRILYKYNASIDRGLEIPIKDLSVFHHDVKTRVHEFEIDVYLRTDVRWYKERAEGENEIVDEKAEKAYILLKNNSNETKLRVIFNG